MSRIKRDIRESCLELEVAGETLSCRLRRSSRRRTLALRVSDQGELVVNAPLRVAERAVRDFVGKHVEWIRARQAEARCYTVRWEEGMLLPYLGRDLTLRLSPSAGRPSVRLLGSELHCAVAAGQEQEAILAWYRRVAREHLARHLDRQSERIGRAVPPLRLSNARTRWGSLSPKGVVNLNWRLVKGDTEEIDYVICHELAHFRHRNHSAAFWREVETLFPPWETARRRLRENGRRYFQF